MESGFGDGGTKISSDAEKTFLVVGDSDGKNFHEIPQIYVEKKPLRFSPDGKYLGYVGSKGDEIWWVVEKVPSLEKE